MHTVNLPSHIVCGLESAVDVTHQDLRLKRLKGYNSSAKFIIYLKQPLGSTTMNQDTIHICQQKTSFKNNVTGYQTKRQRASLHMLLAISFSCWLMFVYLLHQQSWQYASMALLVCVSVFAATLMLSRIFNTWIIWRRYPKYYRSWYQWDREGIEKEWIGALDTFLESGK